MAPLPLSALVKVRDLSWLLFFYSIHKNSRPALAFLATTHSAPAFFVAILSCSAFLAASFSALAFSAAILSASSFSALAFSAASLSASVFSAAILSVSFFWCRFVQPTRSTAAAQESNSSGGHRGLVAAAAAAATEASYTKYVQSSSLWMAEGRLPHPKWDVASDPSQHGSSQPIFAIMTKHISNVNTETENMQNYEYLIMRENHETVKWNTTTYFKNQTNTRVNRKEIWSD